jgi:hypothetical protein
LSADSRETCGGSPRSGSTSHSVLAARAATAAGGLDGKPVWAIAEAAWRTGKGGGAGTLAAGAGPLATMAVTVPARFCCSST